MSLDTYSPQPNPTPGRSDVTALVVADLERRAEAGAKKYGTRLLTHNGRNALIDAYQEALDLACYLRQAIEEMTDGIELTRTVPATKPKPEPVPEGMLTHAEASAYLGCNPSSLREWHKANPDTLPVTKQGNRTLYSRADLDVFREARSAAKAARKAAAEQPGHTCEQCGASFYSPQKQARYCGHACYAQSKRKTPEPEPVTEADDEQELHQDISLLVDSRACANCQSGYQYEPGQWACAIRLSMHCKPSLVSRHWQPRHVLGASA